MKNKLVSAISIMSVLLGGSPVLAVAPAQIATLSTPTMERTLTLPPAAENSPVISLGNAIDPGTGEMVEGFAIVHYKKEFSHRPQHTGGRPGGACFGFLASGAKWKTVEPWVANFANNEGLDAVSLFTNFDTDVAKWEDAADGVVGGSSADVLGAGLATTDPLVADTASPDDVNEVYFGEVSNSGAIAVTIVWGIFGGPPSGRKLVEWDMIFDENDFNWSLAGESDKMDFENIATHELGHSVGLADLYESTCSEETMYGYGDNGETKKRDLNTGDLAGMNQLY